MIDKRWKYSKERSVFGVKRELERKRVDPRLLGIRLPPILPKNLFTWNKKRKYCETTKFFYRKEREIHGWAILLPNYSKLFLVFHPQFSRIQRSSQTSSSLKFLLVKFVSRESREKSFAGKRSCPPIPFYSRFSRKNGRDLKDLPLPLVPTLSPSPFSFSRHFKSSSYADSAPKIEISRGYASLEITPNNRAFPSFVSLSKKKRGKFFVFRNNFVERISSAL